MTEIVTGLADLQKALDQLPVKLERNVLRGALRAGAKVQQQAAKNLVPVAAPNSENQRRYAAYAGALRDSLRIKTSARGGTVKAIVSAGNATAYYARWVEKGTAPHTIKPRARKSLFFAGLLRETIEHPGAKPKPFLQPALEQTLNATIAAIGAYIRKRLTKAGIETPDT